MADPKFNSLVERLNALKPTTVNLDPPMRNTLNLPSTSAEPLSREDALAQRLKSLRERPDETPSPVSRDPPPPYTEADSGTEPPQGLSQRRNIPSPPSKKAKTNPDLATRSDKGECSAGDDDRTLEDILDGLVLDDESWSMSEDDGDDRTSKRVEELLANLGKKPGGKSSTPPDEMDLDADKDKEDDNSDGEEMTRRVRDVLDRTMDELKLEGHIAPNESEQPPEQTSSRPQKTSPTNPDLTHPTVPQISAADSAFPDLPNTPTSNTELSLPNVPTNLQDPVPSSDTPADPFESSIAARLAALKGPGHKSITTDAFGLPSAPTFQPEDRPVPGVAKKPGYSDEDMKTWCIVCLEDATVRCVGCDGDVYCARCWRDMHVGPAAGYDERGHSWEKFDPRKV